jgi:hypothetical protein
VSVARSVSVARHGDPVQLGGAFGSDLLGLGASQRAGDAGGSSRRAMTSLFGLGLGGVALDLHGLDLRLGSALSVGQFSAGSAQAGLGSFGGGLILGQLLGGLGPASRQFGKCLVGSGVGLGLASIVATTSLRAAVVAFTDRGDQLPGLGQDHGGLRLFGYSGVRKSGAYCGH